MKKVIMSVFILLIIISISIGCFIKSISPHGLSAEETVRFYFENWNKQNYIKMNSVVKTAYLKHSWLPNSDQNYIRLISCEEHKANKTDYYRNEWYKEPYDFTMVRVQFEPNYKSGNSASLRNQLYGWSFYLIKEKENSDWKIVMYGAG